MKLFKMTFNNGCTCNSENQVTELVVCRDKDKAARLAESKLQEQRKLGFSNVSYKFEEVENVNGYEVVLVKQEDAIGYDFDFSVLDGSE